MFGGSGLGAAIAAMEGTSDRPVVWATAQYLLFAKVGTVVDLMSLLQFMVKRQHKLELLDMSAEQKSLRSTLL